ncbi:hypothetical protein RGQ30_19860 [Limnobacter thiooxidans]|uniref:Integrase catalytic domain-containing protein n=1 Tax=Limnobacter thiooxidans TaxID=131080 RepID=A0AA86MEW9_9BURK|nr:hypothetical protein RGQ30_19860 [Limnobacter thiooxidans]
MPDQRNIVWSYDFVYEACVNCQTIKCPTIVDEYTRECSAIDVAGSIRSKLVIDVLSRLISVRGAPKYLRSDNGPEFVATKLLEWAVQVKLESVQLIRASHGKTVPTKASTENSEMSACRWSGFEKDLKHE